MKEGKGFNLWPDSFITERFHFLMRMASFVSFFHRVRRCGWSGLLVLILLRKQFVSLALDTCPSIAVAQYHCITKGHYAMSIGKACASQMEGHMPLTNL